MNATALLARRLAARALTRHACRTASVRPLCAVGPKPSSAKQSDDLTKVETASADDDLEQKPGAIGGFMRGLIGGHNVAAEDAYIAAAKERGEEIPPPPPPRSDLVALKRRKRPADDEDEPQGGGIRDRLFSRFSGSAFMRGAFEARERISERIEESDNPVVNFFRNVFAENEMAQVIREIRLDDKEFTLSAFLEHVEHELVPSIMNAYLRGDREELKLHTTEEAYNMLNASIKEREVTGVTMDTNILAMDNVELSAARLLEDAPVLIVSFSLQQINCMRNLAGDVVEGAEDDIRAVYYLMAFIREFEHEDDKPTGGGMGSDENGDNETEKDDTERDTRETPPWKLLELVIRGAHSTI